MQHAIELDPQNFFYLQQMALTYKNLRRYSDLVAVLDRALKLAPADVTIRVQRAEVDFDSRADTKPLRKTIQNILAEDPNAAEELAEERLWVALWERDFTGAAQALEHTSPDGLFGKEGISFPRAWCEGLVARARGDADAAQRAFSAARERVAKIVRDQPNDGSALCALGMIDAALGHKKEAIREGRHALELLPIAKDAIDGPVLVQYLAVIYAWTGKKDAAFEQLEAAAKIPGNLSYGQLRLDPLWDPLRNDPRFDKVVASLAPK
jgi:serine/threonine-protein kinase